MWEVLELALSLFFKVYGALVFDWLAEWSMRWLKIW